MKLLLLISALAVVSVAKAQTNSSDFQLASYQFDQNIHSSLSMQPSGQFNFAVKSEKHWKKLRTTGIILSSFGAACIVGGIYFITEDRRRNGAGSEGFGVAIGSAGIIGGAMAVGGGVAMLTIGSRHLKKIRNVSISTSSNGLGVALRF